MEEYRVCLPKLGESILEATVVRWFKREGDFVQLDEPLLEVSTDKINSEIPSPVSGILKKIEVAADQELKVGEVLGIIQVQAERKELPDEVSKVSVPSESFDKAVLWSPALLLLAKTHGIEMKELTAIQGTGRAGRVTKRDLERYIEERNNRKRQFPSKDRAPICSGDRIKITGLRKAIADNTARSFYTAPHATLVTEIDVTECLEVMREIKPRWFALHGIKLTITSFIARAIGIVLPRFPWLNASIEDDTMVLKHGVHLGIAVSVEEGILVPIVKNCHQIKLGSLAKKIGSLSLSARSAELKPDEVQGGTITLTNFGMTGITMGIPIIRHPEVAIIGVGSIQERVVPLGDRSFGIRSILFLSLTFDHRIVDGIYGCRFLGELKQCLENQLPQMALSSDEEISSHPS